MRIARIFKRGMRNFMAEIVLGLAMSHSPQVSQEPKWWSEQARIDQKRTPYEELLKRKPDWIDQELSPEVWEKKHSAIQSAIADLAQTLNDVAPDVVVLLGDDQEELFLDDCMPTFSVFWGDKSWDGIYPWRYERSFQGVSSVGISW
jgi:3-O-methylgallate 3,4-dioxygenase